MSASERPAEPAFGDAPIDRAGVHGSQVRHPVEVLAEDYTARLRRGESPSVEEYCARHPALAEELRALFPTLVLVERVRSEAVTPAQSLPSQLPFECLGEYRLVREIGRGGMGIVFEAVQESLGRRVALKVLPEHVLMSARRRDRFLREARAAASLHHTNIVPVFDVGQHEGFHFYVMQFIDGQGLDAVVRQLAATGDAAPLLGTSGPLHGDASWRRIATIGVQVAGALAHAHAQGTLHRDIKPSNVLLDAQGVAWIADFGLAKLESEASSQGGGSIECSDAHARGDLTRSGDVLGTLRYMAPEQRAGQPEARSDQYGLGLTLYELLTLRPAFASEHELLAGKAREPTLPSRLNPAVPRDLETIVLKACAPTPAQRYANAQALADDLQRFLDDLPIRARPTPPHARAVRWCRRNPALAGASGVALGALVLAAGLGWWGYGREVERRHAAEVATRAAQESMQMSLGALERIFDALASDPDDEVGWPGAAGPRAGASGSAADPPRVGLGQALGGRARAPGTVEAAALLGSILTFYDEFAARSATEPSLQIEAARAHRRVAHLHTRLGQGREAVRARERALELLESLCELHPENAIYRRESLETRFERWIVGDAPASDADLLEFLDDLRGAQHAGGSSSAPWWLELEAAGQQMVGTRARARGDTAVAEHHLQEAIALFAERFRLPGNPRRNLGLLAAARVELVRVLLEDHRPGDALQQVEAARADLALLPDPPPRAEGLIEQAAADALDRLGSTEAAAAARARAEAAFQRDAQRAAAPGPHPAARAGAERAQPADRPAHPRRGGQL